MHVGKTRGGPSSWPTRPHVSRRRASSRGCAWPTSVGIDVPQCAHRVRRSALPSARKALPLVAIDALSRVLVLHGGPLRNPAPSTRGKGKDTRPSSRCGAENRLAIECRPNQVSRQRTHSSSTALRESTYVPIRITVPDARWFDSRHPLPIAGSRQSDLAVGCLTRVRRIPVLPIAPARDIAVRPARGVLLRFQHFPGRSPADDAPRNAAWDDLLALADRRWTWRDPDSLSALAVCLVRLARDVAAEWPVPRRTSDARYAHRSRPP